MHRVDDKYQAWSTETPICAKNCEKSSVNRSIEKLILLNFVTLLTIFFHDCLGQHNCISNSVQVIETSVSYILVF